MRKKRKAEPEALPQVPLRPVTPGRAAATEERPTTPAADLERGVEVAVMAAIGRLQLSLDLLERRVERIEEALAGGSEAEG